MPRSFAREHCKPSRLNPAWALLFGVFCVTCQKADPNAKAEGTPAASAPSAVVAPVPAIPEAAAKPGSACAGQYQGTYTVAPTKADITQKEGAPAAWDKDDGKALSGPGEIALKVDADNVVSGTAKGALGQQTLRGSCDENTLRIQLDSANSESNSVQNAIIVAQFSGAEATGNLMAATGDSLVRRSGSVSLKKLQ